MGIGKPTDNIDTSNIFEEFEGDAGLNQEVEDIKQSEKQDVYYYLSRFGVIMQNLVIIVFIILGLGFAYLFIQENENMANNQMIDPFCKIILGDIPFANSNDSYCSSISYTKNLYNKELKSIKQEQSEHILALLTKIYSIENFSKSKEVIFLLTKSSDRLKVLEMLEKFDTLKNDYEPIEKNKIQCSGFKIDVDNVISMNCEAFSSGFEKEIKGYGGDKNNVMGSSISIASSFMNYIERKSDYFTILEREKVLNSTQIFGDTTGFTHKTSFKLKLKYNNNSLSL